MVERYCIPSETNDSAAELQRISWPLSSTSCRDSERLQYRNDFLRLYDRTAKDVWRTPISEEDSIIPSRDEKPRNGNDAVEQVTTTREEPVEAEATVSDQVTVIQVPPDPNLVDWEGEDDPLNPLNWPSWKKIINITTIVMMCVTHAFAATAFIPSIRDIQEDFRSNDSYLSAFIVSAYVLGSTAGPLCIVPLAEIFGRSPLYHLCNLLFIGCTCWCAVTKNLPMLTVARFFAGCGGAVTGTLAAGSMMDMVRGSMSRLLIVLVGLALYVTPAISPLAGSYIHVKLGWPWIFWVTAIMGALCSTIGIGLSETYTPVLLSVKANRRRQRTHNVNLFTPFDEHPERFFTERCWAALRQSLRIFVSPSFFVTSFVPGTGFAFMYIVYITLPQTSLPLYIWPANTSGSAYIGIAVGILIAGAIGCAASDRYVKLRARNNNMRAKDRLIPLLCFWPLASLGLLLYGYCVQQKTHWVGPPISLGLFGAGVMFAIVFNSLYITDEFSANITSAIHAKMLLQSSLGGIAPLFSYKLYECFSPPYVFYLLGSIALALSIVPGILYLLRRGDNWVSEGDS